MFKLTKQKNKTNIEKEINRLIFEAGCEEPDSEKYSKIVESVEKLCKAKSYETEKSISPDTILTVCGSILGIVLILGYEQVGVISSKALGFVIKGRV